MCCAAGGVFSLVLRRHHHERPIVEGKRVPAWPDLRKTSRILGTIRIIRCFCGGIGADRSQSIDAVTWQSVLLPPLK